MELDSSPASSNSLIPTTQQGLTTLTDQQQKARDFYHSGLYGALNSQKAYLSDLGHYLDWYGQKEYQALPSTPQTLAEYVTDLAESKAFFTIQRRLASIAKYHRINQHLSPTTQEPFKVFMKGVKKKMSVRQKEAPDFTLEEFRQALTILPATPTGIRDRLLLVLGFTGAFRRSELVALNLEDLTVKPSGLLIQISRSKTNQAGEREEKYVAKAKNAAYCPLTIYQEWLSFINRSEGPLFVRIRKGERPTLERLSDDYVNLLTKRMFQQAGKNYTAHSLRASFVTIAKDSGVDNRKIQNQTKHKTTSMLDRYDRRRDVITQNASTELDL
ncbi:site-specific integrase [Spirosoma endophyticum]|uniref:Site-specific recombinase XerD n=1 Tax=Spirosoma endophyticum TaxID=662367 RepID=A0A1I2BBM5_9BACT|nr:site-specific integrase [Spirosoma endophyticum]SFE53469.1 Site-specific recombinase XerD [Spirosoma endophyticum]